MPAPPTGLDITPNALIVASLRKKGKAYSVARHAVGHIEHGVVVDGEVHDVEALSNALRELWETEGLKDRVVNVGIANQRTIVRTVELPRIRKKSQLKQAISFEVADNLPIPLEEAVWDYHTVENFKDETGMEKQRHVVVMVYRESVERYRDAIEGAGLKLRRIDLSGFALMRAGLPALRQEIADLHASVEEGGTQPAIAMLDIGPNTSNLVVARDGICDLNRIVSFGTSWFSQTLAEQFGWTIEDAERVKLEAGVLPLGGVESAGDPYTDTRRIMQYVADQFAQELKTTFDYYQHTATGQFNVQRLVLAGEGALLRGIEQRFAQELAIPVSILDASPRLDIESSEALGINHAQFGTALGLAMEEAA